MEARANDVTIVGGGLAGLSLALQVKQQLPEASITVLEKQRHPAPEAAFKVGESTVEVAAHYFGNVLGLKQHIVDEQLPKLGLRFFFPAADNSRIEDRLELGGKRYPTCPSYQLDRGRFENHLAERCLAGGIQFADGAEVSRIQLGRRGRPHRVEFLAEGTRQAISTRWVVDASGRRAFLKRQLGLEKPSAHVGNAVWFRLDARLRVDDWSSDPDWQAGHSGTTGRWYSTNHLMGEGYWVWLIPLASGSTSVGIVAAEEFHPLSTINSLPKSIDWLERYEPQAAAAVKDNLDRLQDFRAIRHYAVECRQVFSARRWGITGEAGFFHDPFYSPGSDFISIANTFLSDLIRRDLTGRAGWVRALSYDRIYKRFYYGTLTCYRGQYGLFGNPRVMAVKVLWDYLVYWSITGFIFMQGRMCNQLMYLRNLSNLSRLGRTNHAMQEFFRRWHVETAGLPATGTIDISQVPLIREMNDRLIEEMDSRRFNRSFAANTAQLETLAHEIVAYSGLAVRLPARRRLVGSVRADAFEPVFQVLNQPANRTSASVS